MTAGGGFDVKLANHFSVRPVKVDYLLTRSLQLTPAPQSQKNLRVRPAWSSTFNIRVMDGLRLNFKNAGIG